jgi:hypothetical protein
MCIVTGPRIDLAITLIDRMKRIFTDKGLVTFDSKETVIEINRVHIDGTWNNMSVHDQESILEGIARVKGRIESRRKEEQEEELKYREWDVILTQEDSPFYELSKKISSLYNSSISKGDNNKRVRFNPLLEIKKYRRVGDVLRYLYINDRRPVRAIFKNPSLMKIIKDEGKEPLIRKGSEFFKKYREPTRDGCILGSNSSG